MPHTLKVGGKKRKLTPWIQAAKAYWPKAKKNGMSYSKMLSSDEFREFYKANYEEKNGGNVDLQVDEYNESKEEPSEISGGGEEESKSLGEIDKQEVQNIDPEVVGGKKAKKASKKVSKKVSKKARKSKKRFFGLL